MASRKLPVLLAGLLLAGAAHASQASHVHASHAWIRLLPANLPAGGYVVLANDGDRAARLAGAGSRDYGSVMLHQSTSQGGMDVMRMVDHIDIPAHGRTALAPASYHLMLGKASHPLKPGDKVPVTLRFADGSTLHVDFLVRPANASGDGRD